MRGAETLPLRFMDARATESSVGYQPYYVAFARSNGLTPEEQDAALVGRGGHDNAPFIAWMRARHREFRTRQGIGPHVPYSPEQRRRFLDWLEGEVAG